MIKDFLVSVWGEMQGNVVLGLRDMPGPKGNLNRFYNYVYPEQLDDIVQWVEDHRNEDAYLSPLIYGDARNASGRIARTPENALYSQTVYQDSDLCPIDKFRLQPSIHLVTSGGKYQDFWQLTEPVSAKEAAEASHRIAIAHREDGSDPSSWSANKLLRIPGTVNTNHGFPEAVTGSMTGNVYDLMDVLGAYDDIDTTTKAPQKVMRLPEGEDVITPEGLPEYSATLDKLPSSFNMDVLLKEVPDGTDRSRMRWRMLADLFRLETLEFEEVITLAWHAPASRKWREDARSLNGLVGEAMKIQAEVEYELHADISAPSADEIPKLDPTRRWPELLDNNERQSLVGYKTFIDRYVEWNQAKLKGTANLPYVRMNAWSVLAGGFADCGFIPRSNRPEPLNFYSIAIGDSGSGKTSAMYLWKSCMKEIFDQDASWSVGSNASPNALQEKLIERDKKITFFNADEAHGWFKTVNTQQWSDGIYEDLAKYYDGDVPPVLRTGNREISGKSAETIFMMHMMGTMKGELSITNVLTKSMFLSGFLARFIWFIGDESEITFDSMEEDQTNSDYVTLGFEPMSRQWAAEFSNTKKQLRVKHKRQQVPVLMDKESLDRMQQVKWKVTSLYRDHPQWEIIEPSIRRFGPNVRRAASLLALEEGKDVIDIMHTRKAIEAGEEWVGSMVAMAEKIADSEWSRACDEIDQFLQSKGTRVRHEVVIRKFRSRRTRDLLEQIDSLKIQGRVTERQEDGAKWLYSNE